MGREMNSNSHRHEIVFVSFERTDIIQFSNITFYYNRFSTLANDSKSQWVDLEIGCY